MKRILIIPVLLCVATLALALPTPKEVAAAVGSGNLPQAETMLREVVAEKPGSAKAHYELGQVLAREGRKIEAAQELQQAQKIDPALKFVSDPQHFNNLLAKVTASPSLPPTVTTPVPVQQVAGPATPSSFPWGFVLIGGGLMIFVWVVVRRFANEPLPARASVPAAVGAGYGGAGVSGGGYAAPAPTPGSGIGGALLGGVAGLAAGYGLAKVLEGSSESHHTQQNVDGGNGFVPIEPSPQADYGAFDAGAGDSWDSGDSGDASSSSDPW